jgi:hypothetical protein
MTQPPQDNSIDLICPECGYDLRGLSNQRCPECGTVFDRATATLSRIPWVQRKAIGSFRAYWRTVWLSTIRIKQLADEVTRPVSLREAQRFRLRTSLLASIIPVGMMLFMLQEMGGLGAGLSAMTAGRGTGGYGSLPPAADFTLPWAAGMLLWPTSSLGILLFFNLVSGVGSYWFHPGNISYRHQNRAVALSHYACAPLACASLSFLLGVGLMALPDRGLFYGLKWSLIYAIIILLCYGLGASCIFIFWLNTLRLLKRTVGATGLRMTSAAIGLPIAWLICAGISFGALPWVIGYIFLMVDAMRH